MAIAWIASRDLKLVREQSVGFRSQSTHWLFRHWMEPVEDRTKFAHRMGWFLMPWGKTTVVRLHMLAKIMEGRGELPRTWQMSVHEAEHALWHALADNRLVAEAMGADGRPVDIPAREWAFLKLFEDREEDVLRYDALDRFEPFTKVKLKRDNLMGLWPSAMALGTINNETSCARWLAEEMARSPTARPKPKAWFWSEAEKQFPGIGKRQFTRAWDNAIVKTAAVAWRRAGRQKKSNQRTS